MSKRFPHAKYVLPLVLDPPRICTTVNVPNDIQHIAAFLGAIRGLGSAVNWQDDLAHTAKDVAQVWREVFDDIHMGNCAQTIGDDVQFRQKDCLLQFSVDCVNWITLYDPTDCINAQTGQPGPAGPIIVGDCKEYDVDLPASGTWKLPIPVNDGYTIEISNTIGGWNDGGGPPWACPDGSNYILGVCTGSQGTNGADPMPAQLHMSLIALVGAVYYYAADQSITVPGGTGPVDVYFQANDSDLTNNLGSVHFHVRVCAEPNAACSNEFFSWYDHTTTSITPWTVLDSGIFSPAAILSDPTATYVFTLASDEIAGTGYLTGTPHHPIGGMLDLGQECHLTEIKFRFRITGGTFGDCRVWFHEGGSWHVSSTNLYFLYSDATQTEHVFAVDNHIDGIALLAYGDVGNALGSVELNFSV